MYWSMFLCTVYTSQGQSNNTTYSPFQYDETVPLKGHTNETYFSIFLYISVRHRSLTLLIKFFEIQIRTHGDIRIQKLTLRFQRYGESSREPYVKFFFKSLNKPLRIEKFFPG